MRHALLSIFVGHVYAAITIKTVLIARFSLHRFRYVCMCTYVKSRDYGDVSAGAQQGRRTMSRQKCLVK